MDNATLISLAALVVSILALPTSYFVATRQVKVSLDLQELRVKQRTRIAVADRLDDLVSLFFGATQAIAEINLAQQHYDSQKLQRHIQQIDEAVTRTGILDRLAKAIDDYIETGDSEFMHERGLATKLTCIRGQIQRGSMPPGVYATWDVLNICHGNELSLMLR